jgi:hypothetical protein
MRSFLHSVECLQCQYYKVFLLGAGEHEYILSFPDLIRISFLISCEGSMLFYYNPEQFGSTLVGESIDDMEKHLIECDAFKDPKEGFEICQVEHMDGFSS